MWFYAAIFFIIVVILLLLYKDRTENGSKNAEAPMSVIDAIMTRTCIRRFTDQPVDQSLVDQLLRAGMAAPSAMNRQPWHFVVINSRDVLDRIAESSQQPEILHQAEVAIVVCGNLQKTLEGQVADYWVDDTSAASQNILLAAHALSLGAVWMGGYPNKVRYMSLQSVLGLPEHIVPLNLIAIGYPAEHKAPKDKYSPANVSYNRYEPDGDLEHS